jgi:flagellar biosynthesis/type III secretory pathway M-ring protein FliF/YscJ
MVTRYGGKALLFLMFGVVLLTLRKGITELLAMSISSVRTRVPAAGATGDTEHFEGIPEVDDQVINDIKDYASENPDRVADVVQSWIHEMNLGNTPKEKVGDSSER